MKRTKSYTKSKRKEEVDLLEKEKYGFRSLFYTRLSEFHCELLRNQKTTTGELQQDVQKWCSVLEMEGNWKEEKNSNSQILKKIQVKIDGGTCQFTRDTFLAIGEIESEFLKEINAQLYESNLGLKMEFNRLKQDNTNLKANIAYTDRQNNRLASKIEDKIKQEDVLQRNNLRKKNRRKRIKSKIKKKKKQKTQNQNNQSKLSSNRSKMGKSKKKKREIKKVELAKVYKEEYEIYDVKQKMIELKKKIDQIKQQKDNLKQKIRFSSEEIYELKLKKLIAKYAKKKGQLELTIKKIQKKNKILYNQNQNEYKAFQTNSISPKEFEENEEKLLLLDQQKQKILSQNREFKEKIEISKEKNQSIETYIQTSKKERTKFNEQKNHFAESAQKTQKTITQQERDIQQVEREIEKVDQNIILGYQEKSQIEKSIINEELGSENNKFENQDIFQQLEQIFTKVKLKRFEIQEQICQNIQQDQKYLQRIKILEKQLYNLSDKINLVDEKYEFIEAYKKKLYDISDSIEGSFGDSFLNESDVEIEGVSNYKKIRVDLEQVKLIGYELALGMMAKGKEIEEIEKCLIITDFGNQGYSTITELQAILSQEPFDIQDPEKIQLVSRYLIEDNDQYMVKFDPTKKQNNEIIKSIFRKMVGDYKLFSSKQDQDYYAYWCDQAEKNHDNWRNNFKQAAKQKESDKGMYVDYFQIHKMMDNILDDSSTPAHRDYMLSKLYKIDGDLMKLNWSNFFSIFDGDHPQGISIQTDTEEDDDEEDNDDDIESEKNENE